MMKQLGVIISQSRIIIKYRVIIDYALIAIMNFLHLSPQILYYCMFYYCGKNYDG